MGYLNIKGITINATNAYEKDRYITYFTDKLGKINVKLKSVRNIASRRIGYTEEFLLEKVLIYRKGNTFIATEISLIENFRGAKEDFIKSIALLYIKELIVLFVPYEQEEIGIFRLLIDTLTSIEVKDREFSYTLLAFFMCHFLKLIGYPIPLSMKGIMEHNLTSNVDILKDIESLSALDSPLKITKPSLFAKESIDVINFYIMQQFEEKAYLKFLEQIKKLM
jgi:hypothetical protein